MYPSPFMRVASTAYVVATESNGKLVLIAQVPAADDFGNRVNAIHIPMWFSAGDVRYGIVEDD